MLHSRPTTTCLTDLLVSSPAPATKVATSSRTASAVAPRESPSSLLKEARTVHYRSIQLGGAVALLPLRTRLRHLRHMPRVHPWRPLLRLRLHRSRALLAPMSPRHPLRLRPLSRLHQLPRLPLSHLLQLPTQHLPFRVPPKLPAPRSSFLLQAPLW